MTDRIRVALLGAGGRVGSVLLRHLSADPRFTALGICRNAVIAGPLRLADLDVRCGTIRDRSSAEALVGRADVIVNCAVDAGWASTAREANRRLLQAVGEVANVRRFVQFSSIGVYGSCIDRSRATFERPRPHARYAREKIYQERDALRYAAPGRATVILRMGHVYGPYQWLSRAILEFLEARTPSLPFDGRLASNAVHIDNVCSAVAWLASADAPGGTYNLMDRPQRSWRDLVDWHADAVGVPSLDAIDDRRSARVAERYRTLESVPLLLQLVRELAGSIASVPSVFAVSSPMAIVLGQRIVGALGWPRLEASLRMRYSRTRARRHLSANATTPPPPWLLSDEAPGPVVAYPSRAPSTEGQRAIAEWYRGYANPPAIDPEAGR